jgi:hypothetical protein
LLGLEPLEEGDDGIADLGEIPFEVSRSRVFGEAALEAASELVRYAQKLTTRRGEGERGGEQPGKLSASMVVE